ncbi:hypothetical protein A1O1_03132 [Capronia coronata CBS 617.96]|uniref:Clr5 domain-containing protein n=1 Tax=Capronia coronata CBS 617.96 TaxID=1182541 RepID=W9YYG4_9EURO|nr:uncharacterized protein A1O1_03132 [Capronia coronata CBS 617.96]EXJ94735.1 hypothetical protein A1O1_03132 [Capronia coronata CBS 617.96]
MSRDGGHQQPDYDAVIQWPYNDLFDEVDIFDEVEILSVDLTPPAVPRETFAVPESYSAHPHTYRNDFSTHNTFNFPMSNVDVTSFTAPEPLDHLDFSGIATTINPFPITDINDPFTEPNAWLTSQDRPLMLADASDAITEDDQWAQYKEILRHRYLDQDWSLKKLKEYMKTNCKFEKSEAQYKRKFKSWGWRKHLKAEDWKFVAHRVRKRTLHGQSISDVYVDGALVPAERVRREIARYGWQRTVERFASGNRGESWVDLVRHSRDGHLAAQQEIVRLLLFAVSNDITDEKTVAKVLAAISEIPETRALFDFLSIQNATIQAFAERLFKATILAGNFRLMAEFLKRGADPNILLTYDHEMKTALYSCAAKGQLESCRLLLEFGADANALTTVGASFDTPLAAAAVGGNPELVRLLLRHGAEAHTSRRIHEGSLALKTLLYRRTASQAACIEIIEIIQMLLGAGANINAQGLGSLLAPPLLCEDHDLVNFLLQAGADPSLLSTDKVGGTFFAKAAATGGVRLLSNVWKFVFKVQPDDGSVVADFGPTVYCLLGKLTYLPGEIITLLYECFSERRPPREEEYWRTAAQQAIHRGDLDKLAILLTAAGRSERNMDIQPKPGLGTCFWMGSTEDFCYLLEAAAEYSDRSIALLRTLS